MALRPAEGFDPALRQRVVSGIVLALAALAAVLVGGWLFTVLALVAIVAMADEWSRLVPDAGSGARLTALLAAALLPALAVLAMAAGDRSLALAALLPGAALAAAVAALLPGTAPDRVAGGVVYVGLPVVALVWLRNEVAGGALHVLWLFVVVWATDICAYFVGRTVGGPKLAPAISPGKTWSGLLGGMAGAGLLGGLIALAFGAGFAFAATLGVALALVAQAGDLFESALKRRAGVKDSGHLIPGHGGLLDRIDGLVFAAPAFAAVVWLMAAGARP
jgi:phosphatidate cytidylyltransferase